LLRAAAARAGAPDPSAYGISTFSHPLVASEDDINIESM